ncbi:hypothetical protein MHYP_G00203160 [Metynnis hypsauchen]
MEINTHIVTHTLLQGGSRSSAVQPGHTRRSAGERPQQLYARPPRGPTTTTSIIIIIIIIITIFFIIMTAEA